MSSTGQENIPQSETSEAQGVRSEDIEEFVVKLGWFLNGIDMYLKMKNKFPIWLKKGECLKIYLFPLAITNLLYLILSK